MEQKIKKIREEKNIKIKFSMVDELLPYMKDQNPEKWFVHSKLFKYIPIKYLEDVDVYFGKLYISKTSEFSKYRYVFYNSNQMTSSPWFYYSTGISNYGQNFPGFCFVLEEKGLLTDFPFIQVYPKKAIINVENDINTEWKENMFSECIFEDEKNIRKLMSRFIYKKDLIFSLFLGKLVNKEGLENGWENNDIINNNDYNKLNVYLNI